MEPQRPYYAPIIALQSARDELVQKIIEAERALPVGTLTFGSATILDTDGKPVMVTQRQKVKRHESRT